MKKVCIVLTAFVMVASVATLTVWAKTIHNDWVERKLNAGYTETDAYSLLGIMVLSDENVSAFIEQKYKELGDWEEVAAFYNVDLEELQTFVENQAQAAQDLSIPDKLYEEMKEAGMSDAECRGLARGAFTARMDLEDVWQAKQEGKTVNDLIKERTELKNAQLQAATDLTFGEITEEEYIEKMQSLSPEMAMSDIIAFAVKERKRWMETRKAASGISDEELALAQKAGMTDFFAACRLKDAERFSDLTFVEMVKQIKNGADIDTVIKNSFSIEKIEAARMQVAVGEK